MDTIEKARQEARKARDSAYGAFWKQAADAEAAAQKDLSDGLRSYDVAVLPMSKGGLLAKAKAAAAFAAASAASVAVLTAYLAGAKLPAFSKLGMRAASIECLASVACIADPDSSCAAILIPGGSRRWGIER